MYYFLSEGYDFDIAVYPTSNMFSSLTGGLLGAFGAQLLQLYLEKERHDQ
jgi:hypothetical protein